MDSFGPLVDVPWLRARLGDPDLVVVDCRWKLGDPGAGAHQYAQGHVPGAVFLDVDRDMAAPASGAGRHPLPQAREFQAAVRAVGISGDARVVAYDEAGEAGAARLWWLLRHFGHDRVAILDGGLAAWRTAGAPLSDRPAVLAPGDFHARPREDDTAGLSELRERALSGDRSLTLVDARAPDRFRGEHEPMDPVAGHIPGAVNLPFGTLLREGRFLERDELQERLSQAGVGPGADVVAYCGSGVTAAVVVAAAEAAGVQNVRLYPGSWSEWCRVGLPAEALA